MGNKKKYSSYRWNCLPVVSKIENNNPQSNEERIESKKALLKILVENKTLTQEEADTKLKKFKKSLKQL